MTWAQSDTADLELLVPDPYQSYSHIVNNTLICASQHGFAKYNIRTNELKVLDLIEPIPQSPRSVRLQEDYIKATPSLKFIVRVFEHKITVYDTDSGLVVNECALELKGERIELFQVINDRIVILNCANCATWLVDLSAEPVTMKSSHHDLQRYSHWPGTPHLTCKEFNRTHLVTADQDGFKHVSFLSMPDVGSTARYEDRDAFTSLVDNRYMNYLSELNPVSRERLHALYSIAPKQLQPAVWQYLGKYAFIPQVSDPLEGTIDCWIFINVYTGAEVKRLQSAALGPLDIVGTWCYLPRHGAALVLHEPTGEAADDCSSRG